MESNVLAILFSILSPIAVIIIHGLSRLAIADLKHAIADKDAKIRHLEEKFDDLDKDVVLVRTAMAAANANIANILSMVERVKTRLDHFADNVRNYRAEQKKNNHDE